MTQSPIRITPWESNAFRADGSFFFDTLTLLDSYYIQTSYQTSLGQFFSNEIVGQKIDTVVALVDIAYRKTTTNNNLTHCRTYLIVLHYGDQIHGFLSGILYFEEDSSRSIPDNPYVTWPSQTDELDSIYLSSAYFLSPHHLASGDGHDNMVNIVISGNTKKNFTIKTFYVNMTKPNEDIESTIYPESYKQMGKEEIINLIEQVTVKKQEGYATVASIDKNHWILAVTSQELPSLKTLRFLKLIANGTSYDYDPQGLLKEGSVVAYDYYERYANYAPSDLLSTKIRLK